MMKSMISECRRGLKLGIAAQAMALLLSASTVFTATAATAALEESAESVSITMDGARYNGRATLYEDTTYVELGEFIRSYLDVSLSLDATGTMAAYEGENLSVTVCDGAQWIVANGRYLWCETGVFLENGEVYVPVRAAARALGVEVAWDAEAFSANLSGGGIPISSGDTFYNADEVYWLSRIIHAEAGNEPFKGQLAVGNVVMNRVREEQFPDTIYGVIFDTRYGVQFSPIANGSIYREPDEEAVIAAKLCLEGYSLSEEILYFLNPALAKNFWTPQNRPYVMTISGHDFYA